MRSLPCLLALLSALLAAPAFAQCRPQPATWTFDLGVAPVVGPMWQGSRDYGVAVYPDLRVNWRDTVFLSIPDGLRWHAIERGGLTAGPIARLKFGRNEDGGGAFRVSGRSAALLGMGDIGATGELGGFAQYAFGDSGMRARGELRKGFGGHHGVVGDVSLGYGRRSGSTIWGLNAKASFATAGTMQRYFGVNAAQATRTGLAVSRPGSGLVSYGLGGNVVHRLDERIALTGFAGYERLGSGPAGSALIRQRGDADQVTAGIGVAWRFRVR